MDNIRYLDEEMCMIAGATIPPSRIWKLESKRKIIVCIFPPDNDWQGLGYSIGRNTHLDEISLIKSYGSDAIYQRNAYCGISFLGLS
jgi:hypothetical protein